MSKPSERGENVERIKIDKERTWVFSPVNQIAFKVVIQGKILEEQLKNAIQDTLCQYEMFYQRIVLDEGGCAYYEQGDFVSPLIRPYFGDWKEEVVRQQKIPMRIHHGELIRFCYQMGNECVSLLIIAHHIAGDGNSFVYLVQDIMRMLAGESVEYKKLSLIQMDQLPKNTKLRAPTTWLMKYMNRRWRKTGKAFDFNDFDTMYEQCFENRNTRIKTDCLKEQEYENIITYAKENQITINTVITTAFIKASGEFCDVGMAASIREKGYTGMGNYATGIAIQYQYDVSKSFAFNAQEVQKLINLKLHKDDKKYFLLQFMGQMEPTLIDAVYFQACGEYQNRTAEIFSKMFGYNDNPKGISITNLTRLPMKQAYGAYQVTEFIFVPPLVLNAKRIIGVASLGEQMVFSLQINVNEEAEKNDAFFTNAINYLKGLS